MQNLAIIEYKEIRVLTTQQIAEAYETDSKIISKNFERNRDRYVEGKHFICLSGEELKEFKANRQNDDTLKFTSILYLWTEKGAFLHAKSLNTDIAWEVYDRLVDSYFKPKNIISDLSPELQAIFMHDKKIQVVEQRVTLLENTMNLDYEQQQILKKAVNKRVLEALGGDRSNAYKQMSRKVFSECNRNMQDYFKVNSRSNIPRFRFVEAVEYAKAWEPSNNTKIAIRCCNAQMNLGDADGI